MPVNIQLSKISIAYSNQLNRKGSTNCWMVGLGGLEPPTSSLSGMRSSQLSYRPRRPELLMPGGAGRDRTGDLLSANQALSQLSYSPKTQPLPHGRGSEK